MKPYEQVQTAYSSYREAEKHFHEMAKQFCLQVAKFKVGDVVKVKGKRDKYSVVAVVPGWKNFIQDEFVAVIGYSIKRDRAGSWAFKALETDLEKVE